MALIEWAFRPDDPSKQDTREELPDDLAALKVREGLARYAEPEPAKPAPVKAPKD